MGIGTALYAVSIGPLSQFFIERLRIPVPPAVLPVPAPETG